jgi:parallel beta-helix repeat protein
MRKLNLGIIIGFGFIIVLLILVGLSNKSAAYTPHDPIMIVNNIDFANEAADEGWQGDGSSDNPYVIEGYEINSSNANGIEIRNVDKHFIIRDCRMHDGRENEKHGIYFDDVSTGIIDNVESDNNKFGIYLLGSSHNQVINSSLCNSGNGICVQGSSNITTINCSIYGNGNGISGLYAQDNQIINSYFYDNSYAIVFHESSNNFIINCTAYNNSLGYSFWESSDNQIIGSCSYNNSYGIHLVTSSENIHIIDCKIYGNSLYGILVSESSNNRIVNTIMHDNPKGVSFSKASRNMIINSTAYNNQRGFNFGWDSNNNTVTYCNISNNSEYGVYIDYQILPRPKSNLFHHNNFAGNDVNAYTPSDNYWDDNIGEGNYWDDYTGVDGNNDGIGDTPYNIDMDGTDRYPLMTPYTPRTVPHAPQNLQSSYGDSYVNITWSPPDSDGGFPLTNYCVYKGIVTGGETFLMEVENILYYNDTSVTNGITYYYKVSANNSLGEGLLSNEASAMLATVPSEPTGLNVFVGDSFVNLTWEAPASDGFSPVTNYHLYRGEASGAETFLIEVGNVLFYNDTSIINGVTYYFKVSAVNTMGESILSHEVNATSDRDSDGDSILDFEDDDDDNDGYLDDNDAFPLNATEWLDTDYDGVGNNADTDDDNDGHNDDEDAYPLNPDLWREDESAPLDSIWIFGLLLLIIAVISFIMFFHKRKQKPNEPIDEVDTKDEIQEDEEQWTKCPKCNTRLKTKNLEIHMKKVHRKK